MTDATSRARKCIEIALWNLHYDGKILTQDERIHAQQSCIADASDIAGDLEGDGFQIIDTRTHAAVPREPSEADVERVARAIIQSEGWSSFWAFDDAMSIVRAAIAALVQGQTQGGGREDV